MELEYKGYLLQSVYQQIVSPQREEIVKLWTVCKVVPPLEAERRVDEVVLTVRNSDGCLVGVSTAYLQKFIPEEPNPFYFMRMFIRPEDRGSLGLFRLVSRKTREFLKTYEQPGCSPKGVIILLENLKFLGKGNSKNLKRRGWSYWGQGVKGYHIWYECFDGSVLAPPPVNKPEGR